MEVKDGVFVLLFFVLFLSSALKRFSPLFCRCQHLRTLPVQRLWLSAYRLHKVWGLTDLIHFTGVLKTQSLSIKTPLITFLCVPFLSVRTSWQLCPSCWGAPSLRSYSGPSTFTISTETDTSTKRWVFVPNPHYIVVLCTLCIVLLCFNVFLCFTGDDRHRQSDIRHDGEVHLPRLEKWRTQAACGCLLSGSNTWVLIFKSYNNLRKEMLLGDQVRRHRSNTWVTAASRPNRTKRLLRNFSLTY